MSRTGASLMIAEVARLTAESEGRRKVLLEKADELRAERQRAERAEADAGRLKSAWETCKVEIAALRKAVLNQCGDNLCWVVTPETAKALPEAEFIESCRRYRQQIADERGEFTGGKTIAQLEADATKLREALTKVDALISCTDVRMDAGPRYRFITTGQHEAALAVRSALSPDKPGETA